MIGTQPKPSRWIRIGLWTMLAIVTIAVSWLGEEVSFIRQRRHFQSTLNRGESMPKSTELIAENALTKPGRSPHIPLWRRWLGDKPIAELILPADTPQAKLEQAKRLFPEAAITVQQD